MAEPDTRISDWVSRFTDRNLVDHVVGERDKLKGRTDQLAHGALLRALMRLVERERNMRRPEGRSAPRSSGPTVSGFGWDDVLGIVRDAEQVRALAPWLEAQSGRTLRRVQRRLERRIGAYRERFGEGQIPDSELAAWGASRRGWRQRLALWGR